MCDSGPFVGLTGGEGSSSGAGPSHVKEEPEEEDEEEALHLPPYPVDLVFLFLVKFCSNYVSINKIRMKLFKFANFRILEPPFGGHSWAEVHPKSGSTRRRPPIGMSGAFAGRRWGDAARDALKLHTKEAPRECRIISLFPSYRM
jgi:hypothetical protein